MLRQSDSLNNINYQAFLDIFDEDYLLERSPHEDNVDYEASSDTADDEDHAI